MAYQPSICRIVVYTDRVALGQDGKVNLQHPAIITKVHNDSLVNLHVFYDLTPSRSAGSVPYSATAAPGTWRWPDRV